MKKSSAGEGIRRLRVGFPVVDDDRLADPGRELELSREQLPLPLVRRPVAIEVEAGLADSDRALVTEELRQFGETFSLLATRLVRMDPERGEDTALALRDRKRRSARIDSRADRDHAVDAGFTGAGEQLLRPRLAAVEVRVGVDHATAVSSSTRGNRGSAAAIPSAAAVRP